MGSGAEERPERGMRAVLGRRGVLRAGLGALAGSLAGAGGRARVARGVVLLVYYNGSPTPAVQVPLADFFGDGCGGLSGHFSSAYLEKAPESYNASFPMPFERSARVCLRNDLDRDLANYSFVEYEALPAWDPSLGYFHATWRRFAFACGPDTVRPVIALDGPGHLVGRHRSVATDEPLFRGFTWIMEANNEVRIDGTEPAPPGPYARGRGPTYDYLGTEDSFGFSWGFRRVFCGPWRGIPCPPWSAGRRRSCGRTKGRGDRSPVRPAACRGSDGAGASRGGRRC